MTTSTPEPETADPAGPRPRTTPLEASDLDALVEKLKLLEFGLYGLQQYGQNAPLDVDDIGPFYRLAEEIESDVLALQRRLLPSEAAEPS